MQYLFLIFLKLFWPLFLRLKSPTFARLYQDRKINAILFFLNFLGEIFARKNAAPDSRRT